MLSAIKQNSPMGKFNQASEFITEVVRKSL